MKINIEIYENQCGTEIGELGPVTREYRCSEAVNDSAIINDADAVVQYNVEGLTCTELKENFLANLSSHLNKNFSDWAQPNYAVEIERIKARTIKSSSHYSIGAIMGLFSTLPEDVARNINQSLGKKDAENMVLTCNSAYQSAVSLSNKK